MPVFCRRRRRCCCCRRRQVLLLERRRCGRPASTKAGRCGVRGPDAQQCGQRAEWRVGQVMGIADGEVQWEEAALVPAQLSTSSKWQADWLWGAHAMHLHSSCVLLRALCFSIEAMRTETLHGIAAVLKPAVVLATPARCSCGWRQQCQLCQAYRLKTYMLNLSASSRRTTAVQRQAALTNQ